MSLCDPVVCFPIKTDFFFFTNLLGGCLLATTAAASTHIKTMPCQCRNTKRATEREWERERAGGFCQYKTSTVLCPPQRRYANNTLIYTQDTTHRAALCPKGECMNSIIPSNCVYWCLFPCLLRAAATFFADNLSVSCTAKVRKKGPPLSKCSLFSPWKHRQHWVI